MLESISIGPRENVKTAGDVSKSSISRGALFAAALIFTVIVSRTINPAYPIAPVAGILSAAIALQVASYALLVRRWNLLVPALWLLLVTDVIAISLTIYFTGGAESMFFWAYLVLVLAWGYTSGLIAAAVSGALSLVFLLLFYGLEIAGMIPHYQLIPGVTLYDNPLLVSAIVITYALLAIPLVVWAGVRLTMSRQRENLMRGYQNGVQIFVDAVEANDPHTRGHSDRVSHYGQLIAQEMELPAKDVELVRLAGLFHDVGKILLPEDVLTNRGTLTPVQQAAMMTHPILSYEVLERAGILTEILPAVRHHHEWYGGGGYPDGLAGDRIPLSARIISVADAFEAMTAGRYYRARRSVEDAVEELRRGNGTQFDPKVVEAFLTCIERGQITITAPTEVTIPTDTSQSSVPLARRPLPWTQGMTTTTQFRASTILFRMGQEARSMLDLTTLLTKTLTLLRETMDYTHCAIFLAEEGGDLVLQAAIGNRVNQKGVRIPVGEGVIGWVAQYDVARLIPDVTTDQSYMDSSLIQRGTMLVAPLSIEGKTVGVIVVEHDDIDAFTCDDARFMEVVGPYIASVIEVALLHERAKQAAIYDGLTGVYNHRYFYERLEQEMSRARRYGHSLTIAIIDVNGLKAVNEVYGHLAGDQALRKMGQVLKEYMRGSDIIARYGGDEFAIILVETDKDEAEKALARIMDTLDMAVVQYDYDSESFFMPARSYGLATFPWDGSTPTDLFAVADAMLSEAKAKGA